MWKIFVILVICGLSFTGFAQNKSENSVVRAKIGAFSTAVSENRYCIRTFATKPISFENLNYESNFDIYPNPSANNFYIDSKKFKTAIISITDVTGKLIHTENLIGFPRLINANSFSEGIYFLKIETENITETHQIIKTKAR